VHADSFPKAFPHIFPDGYLPFNVGNSGQAAAMGHWSVTHSSARFDNQPGFYHMLMETQQDKLVELAHQLPEQLQFAPWEVRLRYLDGILAHMVGADTTKCLLQGTSAGITVRLGQPNMIVVLEPNDKEMVTGRTMAFFNKPLQEVMRAFAKASRGKSP
jgi:hypothetical protein